MILRTLTDILYRRDILVRVPPTSKASPTKVAPTHSVPYDAREGEKSTVARLVSLSKIGRAHV